MYIKAGALQERKAIILNNRPLLTRHRRQNLPGVGNQVCFCGKQAERRAQNSLPQP